MNWPRPTRLVWFVILGLISASPHAMAFEPMQTANGLRLRWPSTPNLRLCLDTQLPTAQALALGEGVWLWWSEGGLTWPLMLDTTAPCQLDPDDARVALLMLDAERWSDSFGPPAETLAYTNHTYDMQGTLLDADIVVNGGTFEFSPTGMPDGTLDMVVTAGHEMGHVLGLGHPCGDPVGMYPSCSTLPDDVRDAIGEALMFPTQASGPAPRRLSRDDLMGLSTITDQALAPTLDATWSVCTPDEGTTLVMTTMPSDAARLTWTWVDLGGAEAWVALREPLRTATGLPGALRIRRDDGVQRWLAVDPVPCPSEQPDDLSTLDAANVERGDVDNENAYNAPARPATDRGCDGCTLHQTGRPSPLSFLLVGSLLACGLWIRRDP